MYIARYVADISGKAIAPKYITDIASTLGMIFAAGEWIGKDQKPRTIVEGFRKR